MRNVSDLLKGKPLRIVSVSPGDSVLDAIKVLAKENIGAALVMSGEKLVGIFSERDYARKGILRGKASADTSVSELLTERVLCVPPTRTVQECMALMTDKHVRHLPVVKDNQVVGVVSIGDIVKAHISHQQFIIDQLEQYITGR
jgi:CBS domain-containing protein